MKKKKKTIVVLVLLLLVGLTSGYIARTYAKYVSKVENSGTAAIAKWNFTKDNKVESPLVINLNGTPNEETLVNGKIAPGTTGTFDIALKNTSDTGVDYTIKLINAVNVPKNLVFYDENDVVLDLKPNESGEQSTITGRLKAATAAAGEQTKTVTIKWKWLYESPETDEAKKTEYDSKDTTDGQNAAGVDADGVDTGDVKDVMTIGVEIVGVQVEPGITNPDTTKTPVTAPSPVAP